MQSTCDNFHLAWGINILINYFGWEYSLSCEKLGFCEGSTSRIAQGNSPIDSFLNAAQAVKNEREDRSSKGEQTIVNVESNLIVAPNPVSNTATVYFHSQSKMTTFILIDINGKEVLSQKISNVSGKFSFETDNLANGIYNLRAIFDDGKTSSSKLVIKH
jgi:hypothetical protein